MKHKSSAILSLAILVLALFSFFVPSLKMDSSENRTMATFDMVLHPQIDSVVYHESPVERLDAALSDQFPFREAVVKEYLSLFNLSENYTNMVIQLFADQQEDQYLLHPVGKCALIEDTGYLTISPKTNPMDEHVFGKRVRQLKKIHKMFPDMKIYVYYVTQAFDTSWFNNYIGASAADHYREIVDAVHDFAKCDHLVYDDFDDYMNIHYKTDHHWNHLGAKRGYEDIYAMLSDDFDLGDMRVPVALNNVSKEYDFDFLGSYGKMAGELFDGEYNEFSFYEYDLPTRQMSVLEPKTFEEIEVTKIGLYDEYKRGEIDRTIGVNHYAILYGSARDADGTEYKDSLYPFIIRNSEGNGKNLLLCGDSYGRAVRDVLASHFDTTVYIDYRALPRVPIDSIIEKYDIDVMLICSNTGMWDVEKHSFAIKGGK